MISHRSFTNNPTINSILIKLVNALLMFFNLTKIPHNTKDEKIGIIVLHRLGDAIFTIPAVQQIIHHHKNNVFLISFTETIPIYKLALNSINYVNISHSEFLFENRIARHRLRRKVKQMKFTTIYDLTGRIRSASLIFNYPADKIIGLNEEYYRPIYTKFIPIRIKPHITDNYLDVVRTSIPWGDFDSQLNTNNVYSEYIILHPFASVSSKEWGLKKYIELAVLLKKKNKSLIVFPPDRISEDIIESLKQSNIEYKITKTTSELIETIKRCIILIGNDSGPVHIANLLGKPTFTIYGPTNPDYHKPLKGINEYLIRALECSPKHDEKMCFTYGGVYCPSYECMQGLEVKKVRDRVIGFLNKVSQMV